LDAIRVGLSKLLEWNKSTHGINAEGVISPPLIVTKEEIDLGIDALDRHLGIAGALVTA
jgi:hypothetical protein